MPLAGEKILASDVQTRIVTDTQTTDSANYTTTETTVQTVTAALVAGRVYKIVAQSRASSSTGTDTIVARLREDTSTGTELQSYFVDVSGSTTIGAAVVMEALYTAVGTGNKTFVLTGVRSVGAGNCRLEASPLRPSYLYVDRILI